LLYNEQTYKVIKSTFLGKFTEKPISVFTGEFGTGKSTLINNLFVDEDITKLYDVSLIINNFENISNTFDVLVYALTSIDNFINSQFDWEKSELVKLRFLFYTLTNNEPFDFEELGKLELEKYDEKSKSIINELINIESKINNAWLFDLLQILDAELIFKLNTSQVNPEDIKRKLIIAFDNIDLVQQKTFKFITTVLEFINSKKLSDLGFSELLEENDLNLYDILDIRFIITFRDSSAPIRFNHKYCDYYKFVHLQPKAIQNRIQNENLEDEITVEEVFEYTGANPYLFELLIQTIKNGSSDDDIMNYYVSGFNYLIRLHSAKEIQFLIIASFIDNINFYALKIFPEFKDDKDFISNIINRDDILESTDDGLRLKIHIKNIVKAGFKLLEPELYKEYSDRLYSYNNCRTLINKFEAEDFDIFRNLAYFNNFNTNEALEKAFQTDISKAKYVIEKYKDLFNHNKHTLNIKTEYIDEIKQYNKIADEEKYEMKLVLIKNIWIEFQEQIRERNNGLDSEIKQIASELRLLDDEHQKLQTTAEKNKKTLNNYNEEIEKINSKYLPLINLVGDKDNLIFALIMFVVFVIVLIFTIINNEDYHIILFSSINIYNLILLLTLSSSLFFSYKYINKIKSKLLNKFELDRLYNLLIKTKEQKEKNIEDSITNQADQNAVLSKILELKKNIDRINVQILENLSKLNEPYV